MKMVKKESPEEQEVSKGLWTGVEGRMEENAVADLEKAGEEGAGSQLGSCSVAGQSSRSNSVLFGGGSSFAEMSKNPHFHGFSQNLESCGVPARLKTSELSAHQMPKIFNAERSSNASSASRLGGSTQASRESYSSLVSGGLLPEGFEDSFVRLALKARPAQKRIQKRVALMSPMDLGQEMREKQATTKQAEGGRQPRNSSSTPAVKSQRSSGRGSR